MRYSLTDSVIRLDGVGEKIKIQLQELGITTIGDLIFTKPRRYIDSTDVQNICDYKIGSHITVSVKVKSITLRHIDRHKKMVDAVVEDASGAIKVRWFNQAYLATMLHSGMEIVLSGKVSEYKKNIYLDNPLVFKEPGVVPRYTQSSGLASGMVKRKIQTALESVEVPEILPKSIRDLFAVRPLLELLKDLHQPEKPGDIDRILYEMSVVEAFCFFASLQPAHSLEREEGISIEPDVLYLKNLIASLPFTLTSDQDRVVSEVLDRMAQPSVMTRLLNGDVGSGKTAIATLLAAMVARRGYRVAVLAPTEVLAHQHLKTFSSLLKQSGASVALWTGSTKQQAAQDADIIIGTHALLSHTLQIDTLGLVVIDEQHRFGVRQRALLRSGRVKPPHVLAMTATPIPRSLALTLFAGLEVSFLRQRPQQNYQVSTVVIRTTPQKERVTEEIHAAIAAKNQVYVVCPIIDPPEEGETVTYGATRSVLVEYERLQGKFPQYRIGLLHGKLAPQAKQKVLQSFAAGEFDILVTTTVIEVGVDVPNATVMIIEDADRFGLAQLHQLRGRVGRGVAPGVCLLIPGSPRAAYERLNRFAELTDGFAVAELDLETRGPGELTGVVQAGLPSFRFMNLGNLELLSRVREAFTEYVADNNHYTVPPGVPFSSLDSLE